ncbi:MAG: acyltransferase family protein [Lachnospiraceae bacterium]|nr:acyltransferase family protein [Lachnospiraceae bacterium]
MINTTTNNNSINPTFRILSAIAIILVVAGHCDFGIFDLGGLFPYYAFHVAVFAFISGYFYREEAEQQPWDYLKKKVKHLLLPYFLWNLFYGLFAAGLRFVGFQIGAAISIKTLFLEPFLGGHQFGFNFASWFVPMLFVVEVANLFMRKILGCLHLKKEWLIFTLSLLIGAAAVWLSIEGRVWGYYRTAGCLMLLYPAYQSGQLYKIYLEKRDTLSHGLYFFLVCGLEFFLLLICKGRVAYSTVWCSGFVNGPLVPFLTAFLGIAFWLRVARLAAPLWREGNLLDRIGANTFSVMMHHVLGFFLLNALLYLLSQSLLPDTAFDTETWLISYEYRYLPAGMEMGKWLYLFAGILIPLGIKRILEKILDFIHLKRYSEKVVVQNKDK